VGAVVGVWVLLALSIAIVMDLTYQDRVLPGTTLAGHDISGVASAQIGAILDEIETEIALELSVDSKTKQAAGTELGITTNRDEVITTALSGSHRFFWVFRPHRQTDIPLSISIDRDQFNSWLNENFPQEFPAPTNAGVVYNPGKQRFDVTESKPGAGVTDLDLSSIAARLAIGSGQDSFTLVPHQLPPLVTKEQAASAADCINKRITARCYFIHQEMTLHTLTPAEIASMTVITPDPLGGLNLVFGEEQISTYIHSSLIPRVTITAIPEKSLVDQSGNTLIVLQRGADGRTLKDPTSLVGSIQSCLQTGEALGIRLAFTIAAYEKQTTTVTVPLTPPAGSESSHWANVDLTHQIVTLMDGATMGTTYLISSGAPQYPTPTGTFHVYSRGTSQVISGCVDGDCYYYEGVRWVQWFYRDYGFHTAYWHNDFGTPVSHGCVNLREEDAKAVYDWLAIGSAVFIHT
jgi:hypothetical protein